MGAAEVAGLFWPLFLAHSSINQDVQAGNELSI